MRKQTSIIAAAALAVASLSVGLRADNTAPPANTPAANAPDNNQNPTINNQNLDQAPNVSDMDAAAIRDRLTQVTKDAFSSDPLNNIRSDLVQPDADTIGQNSVNNSDLTAVIDQIKKGWHDKYNDDLQPKDEQVALADFRIVQGSNLTGDQAREAGANLPAQDEAVPKRGNFVPGAIQQPGRVPPTATVILSMKGADGSTVEVPLVQAGTTTPQWRIVTAANLNAQAVHDNLLKSLTEIRDDQANWPADQNRAFSHVTQHVLRALETSGQGNGNNAQPAGAMMEPGTPNGNQDIPATQPTGGQ